MEHLFKNIMENGAFVKKEHFRFPYYFQIHDISKAPKALLWSKGLIGNVIHSFNR